MSNNDFISAKQPHRRIHINIAARDHNAYAFSPDRQLAVEDRRKPHNTGRFCDDFHAHPQKIHCGNYFIFTDGQHVVNVFLDQGKGYLAEAGSAKTVGDCVG